MRKICLVYICLIGFVVKGKSQAIVFDNSTVEFLKSNSNTIVFIDSIENVIPMSNLIAKTYDMKTVYSGDQITRSYFENNKYIDWHDGIDIKENKKNIIYINRALGQINWIYSLDTFIVDSSGSLMFSSMPIAGFIEFESIEQKNIG